MTYYVGDGPGSHWPGQNVVAGTRSDRRKAIEKATLMMIEHEGQEPTFTRCRVPLNRRPQFPEGEGICPLCHRPAEMHDPVPEHLVDTARRLHGLPSRHTDEVG